MTEPDATDRDERKRIDALHPDPDNRRTHPGRNLDMVRDALRQVGAARSIVIDEDDVILAGNGVTEAAAAAGITGVRIIDTDGTELVAVRRRGLTAEQKRALALYDNRTAELAEWNVDQLRADQEAGLVLLPFWTEQEVSRLLSESSMTGSASLQLRFGVPPFSVLDARQGYWQDRKRAWLALGIESEIGRGENLQTLSGATDEYRDDKAAYAARQAVAPGGSPRPAMKLHGGKTVRGDGRGRELS